MTFQVVALLDELSDDRPLGVEASAPDGTEWQIALVRHEGELFAIHDECSHAKVKLSEGDVVEGGIECFLHGSYFRLADGAATNLPATQPVAVYPVKVEGNHVLVDIDNPLNGVEYRY